MRPVSRHETCRMSSYCRYGLDSRKAHPPSGPRRIAMGGTLGFAGETEKFLRQGRHRSSRNEKWAVCMFLVGTVADGSRLRLSGKAPSSATARANVLARMAAGTVGWVAC